MYSNKGENFARSLVNRPIDGFHVDWRVKPASITNAGLTLGKIQPLIIKIKTHL